MIQCWWVRWFVVPTEDRKGRYVADAESFPPCVCVVLTPEDREDFLVSANDPT